MIAPIVATRTRSVSFIVLWAGPGLALPVVELQQTEDMMRAEREPATKIAREVKLEREVITALRAARSERELAQLAAHGGRARAITGRSARARGRRRLDRRQGRRRPGPRGFAGTSTTIRPRRSRTSRCPVLAVNGGMDMQVAREAEPAGDPERAGESWQPGLRDHRASGLQPPVSTDPDRRSL